MDAIVGCGEGLRSTAEKNEALQPSSGRPCNQAEFTVLVKSSDLIAILQQLRAQQNMLFACHWQITFMVHILR